MTDEPKPEEKRLTEEELRRQKGETLPPREAMSTINPTISPGSDMPIDWPVDDPLSPTDPMPIKE
jgi:hypothetical protein